MYDPEVIIRDNRGRQIGHLRTVSASFFGPASWKGEYIPLENPIFGGGDKAFWAKGIMIAFCCATLDDAARIIKDYAAREATDGNAMKQPGRPASESLKSFNSKRQRTNEPNN